jgi:EamA domain-containing membrane protein RarD
LVHGRRSGRYSAYFLVHRRYGLDRLEAFHAEIVLLTAPALWLVGIGDHAWVEPGVIVALAAVTVVGAFAMALYIAASGTLPFGLFGLLGYAQAVLLLIASLVAGASLRPVDALTCGPILIALTLLGVGSERAGRSTSTDDISAQHDRSSDQVQESWEHTLTTTTPD